MRKHSQPRNARTSVLAIGLAILVLVSALSMPCHAQPAAILLTEVEEFERLLQSALPPTWTLERGIRTPWLHVPTPSPRVEDLDRYWLMSSPSAKGQIVLFLVRGTPATPQNMELLTRWDRFSVFAQDPTTYAASGTPVGWNGMPDWSNPRSDLISALQQGTPSSQVVNGVTYYEVDFTRGQTAKSVCGALGKQPQPFTSAPNVCASFHPGAGHVTSASGDKAVAFCVGNEAGECSQHPNTCLNCPGCTNIVAPDQVTALYSRMYVECR